MLVVDFLFLIFSAFWTSASDSIHIGSIDPLPSGAVSRMGTLDLRHGGEVTSIAFSPTGDLVASGGKDKSLFVWNAKTGKKIYQFEDFDAGEIFCIAFSPQGESVAAGGSAKVIKIINLWYNSAPVYCIGHEGEVTRIAFSPDGKYLASGAVDKTVRIWDARTGEQLKKFIGHQDQISSVCFVPGKELLLSSSWDGTIRAWDLSPKKSTKTLKKFPGLVWTAVLSPDCKTLVLSVVALNVAPVLRGEKKTSLVLLDIESGKDYREFQDGAGWITSLAFANSSQTFFTGGLDGTICRWDLKTGKKLTERQGHAGEVGALSASSTNGVLVSGGDDHIVRFWDSKALTELFPSPSSHQNSVKSIAFSFDGSLLATGSSDKTIRIWKVGCPRAMHCIKSVFSVSKLAFFRDGTHLISTSPLLEWNTKSKAGELTAIAAADDIECFNFSRNQEYLAIAKSAREGTHEVAILRDDNYDKKAGGVEIFRRILSLYSPDPVYSVAFSSDKNKVALGTGKPKISPPGQKSGGILVWDVSKGIKMHSLAGHKDRVTGLFFLDGDRRLLSSSLDGTIRVWDLVEGRQISEIRGLEGGVISLDISADGKLLAAGLGDKTVRLWERITLSECAKLKGHQGPVTAVSFSPNARLVASGSDDTTALLWDVWDNCIVWNSPIFLEFKCRHNIFLIPRSRIRGYKECTYKPGEINHGWRDLAERDANKGIRAVWRMIAGGQQSLSFLEKRLRPIPLPDPELLDRLISGLDSDKYERRRESQDRLAELGELAESKLRKALQGNVSPEFRKRVEDLLKPSYVATNPQKIRVLRSIQILEYLGGSRAQTLLQRLAQGAPQSIVTAEAKASLMRLKKRSE